MSRKVIQMRASAAVNIGLGLVLGLVVVAAVNHGIASSAAGSHAEPTAVAAGPKASAGAPNIVLITTDDQSVDDMRVMRQVLRRLGGRGTTFGNAFSPYPLCCPARATILTGQYAQNHHVLGNTRPWGGFHLFDDTNTLPLWLQQAGYRTIILGKYLNGYPDPDNLRYVPPGWDEWRVPVGGIYSYRSWNLNENGVPKRYRGYETGFVTREAVSMIDTYSGGDAPFFMWAGYLAPHFGNPIEADDPRVVSPGSHLRTPSPARKYQDALSFLPLPDKASINERDVDDKPGYIQASQRHPVAMLRELDQQRKESLLSVDDGVSRILAALKANGELDNTVVIFTSDNGYMVGEHRRTGKLLGYEESVRVPLIVAGPGFDTGATRSQKVSLVDLAPTIAELAGATPQLVQDGVPLQSFAANANAPDSRAMLFQSGPLTAHSASDRFYVGIRTNHYVYLEYDTGELELYDLDSDPQELRNLASRPAYADTLATLAAALDRLRSCAGSDCLDNVDELARH